MEDWTKKSDEEVFGGGDEQPGSRSAHWRESEIKRRLYLQQQNALELQTEAIGAQRRAIQAQHEANQEMRRHSKLMLWSAFGVLTASVFTFFAALAIFAA